MGTITKDFSYREFEKTDVPGMQVKNTIASAEVRDSVKALAENVLHSSDSLEDLMREVPIYFGNIQWKNIQ